MAINENLDKIKNAVYGRDVRDAIHDAIEECYEDGKAGSTDLTARRNIAYLSPKVTALEQTDAAYDVRISELENTSTLEAELVLEDEWDVHQNSSVIPRVIRKGGIVTLEGLITNTVALTFTNTSQAYTVTTLPDWAIPGANIVVVQQASVTNIFELRIRKDTGVVTIERHRVGNTYVSPEPGNQFYLNCMWIAADTEGESVDDLESLVDRMESIAEGSVRYDPQTLTDSQKAQARNNIGAYAVDEANDIVIVSDEEPFSPTNKLWFRPEVSEFQVPTYEEFMALVSETLVSGDDYELTISIPQGGADT